MATQAPQEQQPQQPQSAMFTAHRIGRFRLCLSEVQHNTVGVLALMGNTVIVECQPHIDSGCFTYTAYSMLFEPVALGVVAPEYQALLQPSGKFRGFVRKDVADLAQAGKA